MNFIKEETFNVTTLSLLRIKGSTEIADSINSSYLKSAFVDEFSNYTITAENSSVIITANTKAQNAVISAELK